MNRRFDTAIYKPIIILGFARSGTTMLDRLLRAHPQVAIMAEPRTIWMTGNAYRGHDELGADDLTPRIARRIDRKFVSHLRKQGRERFAEKTPSNCLRVPFIHALYPDCRIVHIVRDGRPVVRSLLQETHNAPQAKRLLQRLKETPPLDLGAQIPLVVQQLVRTKLLRRPAAFWGPRPSGWQKLLELPPHIRAARQWRLCLEASLRDGRALPRENYMELRYEDFVKEPLLWTSRILDFAELPRAESVLAWATRETDSRRGERWLGTLTRDQEQELEQELIRPLSMLGYLKAQAGRNE